jgi:hypothetical protein
MDVRIGTCAALSLFGIVCLASASLAGIPVSSYCELWVEPDTLEVRDTADVFVILRDVYGELIPGLSCDFISDRGPTDIIIGTPNVSDENGLAQVRVTTVYEPFFSTSHITVDVEDVIIGPVSLFWMCRAGVDVGDGGMARPALWKGSPNPFRESTEISFALAAGGDVRFEIFDVQGRKVRSLSAGGISAGSHSIVWDGRDDEGSTVASGVYRVRMAEPACRETANLILLR